MLKKRSVLTGGYSIPRVESYQFPVPNQSHMTQLFFQQAELESSTAFCKSQHYSIHQAKISPDMFLHDLKNLDGSS